MSLRPFDKPCNVPRLAIRGEGPCYKDADSAVAPPMGLGGAFALAVRTERQGGL